MFSNGLLKVLELVIKWLRAEGRKSGTVEENITKMEPNVEEIVEKYFRKHNFGLRLVAIEKSIKETKSE